MRFTICNLLWLIPLLSLGSMQAAEPPTDAEVSKLLVGYWNCDIARPDYWSNETVTFRSDHKFLSEGVSVNRGVVTDSRAAGTWSVSEGCLLLSYDGPHDAAKASVTEISDKLMRL